jgi:hypothetical protein
MIFQEIKVLSKRAVLHSGNPATHSRCWAWYDVRLRYYMQNMAEAPGGEVS